MFTGWVGAVERETLLYGDMNRFWIEEGSNHDMDIFLLFYDDLIHNLNRALINLAYFLGVELTGDQLECTISHSEGLYHRKEPISQDMFGNIEVDKRLLDLNRNKARVQIHKCIMEQKCGTSGCGFVHF